MTRSGNAGLPSEKRSSSGTRTAEKGRVATRRSRKRGESLTSPRRIAAVTERQLPALAYRKMGYTYAQIAKVLGYTSAQGAHKAVKSALKRVHRAPAEHVLLLELERVDALFVRPYQDALAGDLMALAACLAIMERKSKLLGLDGNVGAAMGNRSSPAASLQAARGSLTQRALKEA